ncbi:hypothetical protein PCANC_10161 [Puccinia coronata f. sp. avenae]|uniref:Uncharacterized protein n=1 Tax=Puccinia coronata f. sp. avenae TaxID=200324 RepID=A0A2N5V6K3_9BASI|nr:hypothetical protein PCANC_10161 [Puccinia coronata f. sp. avenae]
MSTSQTPNHPVLVPAFLEAHGDTALQCAGISDTALLNLPLTLLTNTALSNTILSGLFFFLSGRLLAPNDGTSPVLNYAQEALLNIPLTLGALIDASNKTFIVGLGQVVELLKLLSYITTGTLREVQIVRNLVDWDMEVNMAVILRPTDALRASAGSNLGEAPVGRWETDHPMVASHTRARWTLHGSVQQALHQGCAHWTLFGSVQWALCVTSNRWTLLQKRPTVATWVKRPLDAFWKRPVGALCEKRPLDASTKASNGRNLGGTLFGSVQWALPVRSAHWTLPKSVQWAQPW